MRHRGIYVLVFADGARSGPAWSGGRRSWAARGGHGSLRTLGFLGAGLAVVLTRLIAKRVAKPGQA